MNLNCTRPISSNTGFQAEFPVQENLKIPVTVQRLKCTDSLKMTAVNFVRDKKISKNTHYIS